MVTAENTDKLDNSHHKSAQTEKRNVALSSVIAALGLTVGKLIIGILTNSLGILSEAAHSALDSVAAIVTYFAVRMADKPPDEDHHYGHGKVENLSAFIETLLLLITCIWIIYEAVERLLIKHSEVDASFWAFLVISVSIFVDISRSRMLFRAARKYKSQALEADALHFSTDIWSSCVVLFGLFCVLASKLFPSLKFLEKMDAIAALGVALIVISVSIQLGKRTIHGLLDAAPKGLDQKIKERVEGIEGVEDCHNIRVRASGPKVFVDVHVNLDGDLTLTEAHKLTEVIETAIEEVVPEADVTVHPEPLEIAPAN